MMRDTDLRNTSLTEIDSAYHEFFDLVNAISAEHMLAHQTVADWSGKDVIADIAGWERVTMEYIEARERGWLGYLPPAEEDGTWDRFNQSNVDPTREWSLDEVKSYFAYIHQRFMRVATHSEHANWPAVVRITKQHYQEHWDDIQRIPEVVESRNS